MRLSSLYAFLSSFDGPAAVASLSGPVAADDVGKSVDIGAGFDARTAVAVVVVVDTAALVGGGGFRGGDCKPMDSGRRGEVRDEADFGLILRSPSRRLSPLRAFNTLPLWLRQGSAVPLA